MRRLTLVLSTLALASTVALAQGGPGYFGGGPRHGPGYGMGHGPGGGDPALMAERIAARLQIDAARAQQVATILAAAHEQRFALRSQYGFPPSDAERQAMFNAMTTLRQQTQDQLATVLSPEEISRLHQGMPGGGPRWR